MGGISDEQTLAEGRDAADEGFALPAGTTVGRYVIEARLGAGGMGVVYAAHDPDLDRSVAVKVLNVAPGESSSRASDGHARLVREAQALARLSHRNIVTIHDVGEHRDRVFIAMERVDGLTLTRWLAGYEPSVREIVDVFIEAGRGLVAVHAAGLVHRDFKPDNVMVTLDPGTERVARVLVMDFGIARSTEHPVVDPEVSGVTEEVSALDQAVTRTGGLVGTPAYMSPEQHLHGEIDHRSDQFSFCVALYEAVYRQRPFVGDNAVALAFAVIEGVIRRPPPNRHVPPWLWRVIQRGLAARAEDRFADMGQLVRRLARDRGRVRRAAPWIAVSTIVGIAAWLYGNRFADPCVDIGDAVDATWDPAARAAVDALEPHDPGSARRPSMAKRLDAYATQWRAARVEACRDAGRQAVELAAPRQACLDDRRRRFEAVVSFLVKAESGAGDDPARLLESLPEIGRCADAEYLSAQVEPPAEAIAAEVDALRAEVSRVDVLEDAGLYEDAIAAGEPALLHGRALGYAPVIAEAARALGAAHLELGHGPQAQALLEEAYLTAGGAGHHAVAAMTAIDLAYRAGVQERDPDVARTWIEHARTHVQRVADPQPLQRALRTTEASVAWADDRYEDAVVAATEALTMAEQEQGADSRVVARVLQNLALYETKAGRPKPAMVHFERALTILEAELGPHHAAVGDVLANMGIALSHSDEPDAALEAYGRALQIRERTLGAQHPDVGTLVQNIAIVHAERGRNELALPMFERALQIREAALHPDHPSVGAGAMNLAISLGLAGRHADAVKQLQRALDILLAANGPDDPTVGMIHFELGNQRRELGDLEQARVHQETAVATLAKTLGAKHPNLVIANAALAETLEAQGDLAGALAVYETALSLGEAVGLRESDLALVRIGTGELRFRLRPEQRDAAVELVARSLEALPPGDNRSEAEAWVAERR